MFNQVTTSFSKLFEKLDSWLDGLIFILPNLLVALIVLALSYFIARYLKKGVNKGLNRATSNRTVSSVLSNVIVAAFMTVVLFVVLSILNLDDAVTALLGTAGVMGLAIGLALQDPLINLFSGVLMSVREMYSIGDLIESNGYFGNIKKITLRSTIIMTPTGQEVVVPNKDVIQNPLVNYSRSGNRRIDLECGVSYGDDLEKVKEVALNAVKSGAVNIDDSRPAELFFKEFGNSSVNFVLRFWYGDTSQKNYMSARDEAIIALKKAFDEHDIMIPFPITTLDFGIKGGVRIDEIYKPTQGSFSRNGSNKIARSQ